MKSIHCIIILWFAALTVPGPAWSGPRGKPFAALPVERAQVLLEQCSRAAPQKVESLWTPTAREMETAEALLPQYFSDKIARLKFQDSCHERGYFHIQPLNQFFRQYAGLVMDGQRFLYLNFFNKSYAGGNLGASREWRFEPVMICDGGPDFWGLEFDLEKQRFQNPRFNGWLSECP